MTLWVLEIEVIFHLAMSLNLTLQRDIFYILQEREDIEFHFQDLLVNEYRKLFFSFNTSIVLEYYCCNSTKYNFVVPIIAKAVSDVGWSGLENSMKG